MTKTVVTEIYKSGMAWRATLQSFDWASLNLAKEIAPELPLVALSTGDAWLQVRLTPRRPNSAK